MNIVQEIEDQLIDGKITLRHLELAHIGYMRRRKDLPEGVRNQFAGSSVSILLRFSERINNAIGIATLSYYRAEQGKDYTFREFKNHSTEGFELKELHLYENENRPKKT